jgi:hypothetical protein
VMVLLSFMVLMMSSKWLGFILLSEINLLVCLTWNVALHSITLFFYVIAIWCDIMIIQWCTQTLQ